METSLHPMTQHTKLSAVIYRFPEEDPCSRDAAVQVTLGAGAAILAERFSDYAESLPSTNWMQVLSPLTATPITPEELLNYASHVPCIVVISGVLTDEEIQLAAQLIQIGGHCTVLVDATTEIRPEWKSVIRLPPHRSRDAQWAWGMRVYLDAMLNRGLICLDSTNLLTCTENRISQFTVVHAKGVGRAMAGVEQAMKSLATRCDLGECDTFLLLFHSGNDIRIKEIHWGIQAFKNAINQKVVKEYQLMVGHLPGKDVSFAVCLMAGSISAPPNSIPP